MSGQEVVQMAQGLTLDLLPLSRQANTHAKNTIGFEQFLTSQYVDYIEIAMKEKDSCE